MIAASPHLAETLVDASPHGILVLDGSARVRLANRAAVNLLGLSPEQLFAGDDLLQLGVMVAGLGEEPAEMQRQLIRPDDRRVWVRFELHPLGTGGQIAVFLTDATPEYRLEQEADAGGDGLGQLVRSAPVAMATTDLTGHLVLWNPACEALVDRSADMVAGSTLAAALGADPDLVGPLLKEAAEGTFASRWTSPAIGRTAPGSCCA